MSNHLAIAAITATLRQVLSDAVGADIAGTVVSILTPDDALLRTDSPRLNVFLYRVAPSAAWRNADLPGLRDDGTLATRAQIGLELHYLVTAYGKSTATNPEAHAILGSAVRVLHETPILPRQTIQNVVSSLDAYLRQSDLADQIELVKLSMLPLSLEDLSKLWSVFFQTPYRPSVAYQASVVLIEGKRAPKPALRVRERDVYVQTFKQPLIVKVSSALGEEKPIHAGDSVNIEGHQLQGDVTKLLVDGVEFSPKDVSETKAVFQLASEIRAGIHAVQVVHKVLLGKPPSPHSGVESNVAPFVVHPTIEGKPDLKDTVKKNNLYGGKIKIKLTPAVGRDQRGVLLLNQKDPPAENPARYCFIADPRDSKSPEDELTFGFEGVKEGTYLVRVQIDGAESLLDDAYSTPAVSIK